MLPAAAAAQQAKPIANWANVIQLTPGSEIRVTLAAGRTPHGFIQNVTPSPWQSTRRSVWRHVPGRTFGASH